MDRREVRVGSNVTWWDREESESTRVLWKDTYSIATSCSVWVARMSSIDFASVVSERTGGGNKGGPRGEEGGASGGK